MTRLILGRAIGDPFLSSAASLFSLLFVVWLLVSRIQGPMIRLLGAGGEELRLGRSGSSMVSRVI